MYNGYEDDPELLAAIEASLDEPHVRAADQTRYGSLYNDNPVTREEMLDQKARAQSYQAELNADHAQREAAEYATKRVNRKKNMLYMLATKIENYADTLKSEITALNPKMRLNPNRPEHRNLLDEIETKQIAIQTKINKYNALAQDIRQWADRNASTTLKYMSTDLIDFFNTEDLEKAKIEIGDYDEFVDTYIRTYDDDDANNYGGRKKPRRKSRAKRGTKKQRKSRKSRR